MRKLSKKQEEKRRQKFNQLEKAILDYGDNKNIDAAKNIALAYYQLEEFDMAIEKLNWVLDLKPEKDIYYDAIMYLGTSHGKRGANEDAHKYYDLLIESGEQRYQHSGYVGKGIIFTRQGKLNENNTFEEAIECLEKAREMNCTEYEIGTVNNNLGEVYQLLENHDKAIELFQLALEVIPPGVWRGEILNGLAISFAHKGEYKAALKCLDEAKEMFLSEDSQIGFGHNLYSAGIVHIKKGDYDRGYKFLREARKIFSSKELLVELAEVAYVLGDEEEDVRQSAFYQAEYKIWLELAENEEGGV